jgi:hypothetical protein
MFYEAAIVDKILKCSYCTKRFDMPRALPCGESICIRCFQESVKEQSENQQKFNCCYCKQEHPIPDGGFPPSRHLELLLQTSSGEIYRSKAVDELKKQLDAVRLDYYELSSCLENGMDMIKDRCSLLKHQVQMKAESLVEQINKLSEEMQKEIEKYQLECVKSFTTSVELKKKIIKKLNEQETFCNSSLTYLNQFKIDDMEVAKLLVNVEEYRINQKELILKLRAAIFADKNLEFVSGENELESSLIGQLRDSVKSSFEKATESTPLFESTLQGILFYHSAKPATTTSTASTTSLLAKPIFKDSFETPIEESSIKKTNMQLRLGSH